MFQRVGFGAAPRLGFPGEATGRAARGEDLAADRAGDHGLRPRHLGEPDPARARLHRVRARRRAGAAVAASRPARRPPAGACSRPRSRARCATCWKPAVQPGGTAPRARIVGWRVGGKTGTAHKQENGGYAAHKYVSSFVGFAPVSDPRLVIAVMLDEPSAGQYYGGAVAAPVFAQVMQGALRLLGVPLRRAARADRAARRGRRGKGEHLIDDVLALLARQGAAIERLTSDSRRAGAGAAFFAWPGARGRRPALHRAGDRARLRGGRSGRARASPGTRGWRVPNARRQGPARRRRASSRTSSTAGPPNRSGSAASPAPTARPPARSGWRISCRWKKSRPA